MLSEDAATRTLRYQELKDRLKEKGYPPYIIDQGITQANNLTDEELNTPKTKNKESALVAISTHNPNNAQMDNIIRNTVNALETSPTMKCVLENKKIIFAKRQPKNLKGHLCKAAFSSQKTVNLVKKCGKKCECCKLIHEGPSIQINGTGQLFHVKCDMDCSSRSVLYIMTCTGCNEQYIGETGNELKTRMTVHRQQIRDTRTRKIAVSKHIAECGQGHFTVFPFYKMNSEDTAIRRAKEHYFINLLKPSLNSI